MWPWPWGSRKYALNRLLSEIPSSEVEGATRAAERHAPPVYPSLTYTEASPVWILLYDHIRRGQISPHHLRRMRDIDLEFIAAAVTSEAHLDPKEAPKLQGNTARAMRELSRRYTIRAGIAVASFAGTVTILTRYG